ncbi:hypothetical protein [Saliphagus infecundisoli]|uniref:Uncharacterized protein n=1 Tax=Saliphagus infecundisoli TaxID=1849069 RepID=A0ABD5QAG0_9EURY|nr:hypothetical protein [Saliphagus infecundisoli]
MNRRYLLVAAALVLAASYLVAGGVVDPATEPETIDRERLVQPAENGSYIWPYTSRDRSLAERTLAINMIVHGPDDRVRRTLADQDDLEWEELDPDEETNETDDGEEPIRWNDAHGSTRYTYVDTTQQGGGSRWITESYQLHSGTYLGSRQHIRAYTTDHDEWTAIQVHQEYFDFFRLRHTVTDIQNSRNDLEGVFLDEPYVEEVRREYHAIHGGWNDGWLSVVELRTFGSLLAGSALGVLGLVSRETARDLAGGGRSLLSWTHRNLRGFVLAVALAGLVVGVRSAALAIEAALLGWITPQAAVVVLYPILALGLPVATIVLTQPLERASRFLRLQRVANRLGRPLEPQPAFMFAVVGLGAGFVLDFLGIGITALPIELLLHRVGLLIALGSIAAGSARSDGVGLALFAVGLLGWGAGLGLPLLGLM